MLQMLLYHSVAQRQAKRVDGEDSYDRRQQSDVRIQRRGGPTRIPRQSERYQVRNEEYPRLDTAATSAGNEDASASRAARGEAGPNIAHTFWDMGF